MATVEEVSDMSPDEAALHDARQHGFDEAFAMGVASLREYWLFLIPYIGKLKSAIEELDAAHGVVFDTIEGRAEGAPTFKDAPREIWDRMTGDWPGILDRSTAEATAPNPPPNPPAAATAEPRESRGPVREVVAEIVLRDLPEGTQLCVMANGIVVAESPIYQSNHVARILARRLVKRAREGIEDKP
jgi:hypothetical protein